jgi:glycerol-3-phosphate acyltransferase PlsY
MLCRLYSGFAASIFSLYNPMLSCAFIIQHIISQYFILQHFYVSGYLSLTLDTRTISTYNSFGNAGVAELADAADLKSAGEILVGSSPTPGTTIGCNMPWLIIILGYLLGSIPTAYIAGHILKGDDIRQMGDENMGAANAFRELNRKAGIVVGIIDVGKGALPVLIAQATNMSQIVVMFTGAAAVIGHNWPVFIGFRGGRGASTTIGVLLASVTQPVLILGGPALLVLLIKKNTTFACAVLFIPLSLVGWWVGTPVSLIVYSVAMPCLVGFTHFLRTRPKVVHQA